MSALLRASSLCILILVIVMRLSSGQDRETDELSEWNGAWRWNFTMPDGTSVRPKLTLLIQDGHVTGTTSFRPGSEAPITNAVLIGNSLRFQVLRERAGRPVLTTYQGKSDGKTITGTIQSDWAGTNQVFSWLAQRAHTGVEGFWVWTNAVAGSARAGAPTRPSRGRFEIVTRVELKQDENAVTGRVLIRAVPRPRLRHGSITNNEVYFEIERTVRQTEILSKYRGKQTGDVISGTVETEISGRTRKANWEARRLD